MTHIGLDVKQEHQPCKEASIEDEKHFYAAKSILGYQTSPSGNTIQPSSLSTNIKTEEWNPPGTSQTICWKQAGEDYENFDWSFSSE